MICRSVAQCCLMALCIAAPTEADTMSDGDALFTKPAGVVTRWSSFENPQAAAGGGGKENRGAKGHAFDALAPGETKTLFAAQGSGTIRRMWITLRPRTPKILRELRLDMYWDGAERPAVSVPMGDFFNWVLGRPVAFENALFANPEARSFVCFIPMPFRTGARITLTNESDTPIPHVFYDVNATLGDRHGDDMLYFHASWRRENPTSLGEDFAILPQVEGSGRFLGCHVGVIANRENIGWWGEGEVKIYLDGDTEYPTLCGTGTEDYIATAWGQGEYAQQYHGCLFADGEAQRYGFYRYHVPDPVYFDENCRVTIQQIGGSRIEDIIRMLRNGVDILPVSVDEGGQFTKLLDREPREFVAREFKAGSWTNYYRKDDYSAIALFYLDKPENNLPPLAPAPERTAGME